MSTTLIISPTIFEAEPVFAELGERRRPAVGDYISKGRVSCLVSGIGCERSSERVKSALEKCKPTNVILAGFCGACGAHLKNGDLVYETNATDMLKIGQSLYGLRGRIACVKRIADKDKKLELGTEGYDGVEMENDFFKESITSSDVKYGHFRWISDSLDSNIPPEFFESTMNMNSGELNLSVLNLMKSILRSPTLIIKLAKFGAEISPAKKRYNKSIRELIKILQER